MARATSAFWLAFATGAPLDRAWRWKDRAPGLPSWAPIFLAALEQTGNVTASVTAARKPLRTVYCACCLLPGLRSAASAALAAHRARRAIEPDHLVRRAARLDMRQWLRLADGDRATVVDRYATKVPPCPSR